jgi:hypothetical protein
LLKRLLRQHHFRALDVHEEHCVTGVSARLPRLPVTKCVRGG